MISPAGRAYAIGNAILLNVLGRPHVNGILIFCRDAGRLYVNKNLSFSLKAGRPLANGDFIVFQDRGRAYVKRNPNFIFKTGRPSLSVYIASSGRGRLYLPERPLCRADLSQGL